MFAGCRVSGCTCVACKTDFCELLDVVRVIGVLSASGDWSVAIDIYIYKLVGLLNESARSITAMVGVATGHLLSVCGIMR